MANGGVKWRNPSLERSKSFLELSKFLHAQHNAKLNIKIRLFGNTLSIPYGKPFSPRTLSAIENSEPTLSEQVIRAPFNSNTIVGDFHTKTYVSDLAIQTAASAAVPNPVYSVLPYGWELMIYPTVTNDRIVHIDCRFVQRAFGRFREVRILGNNVDGTSASEVSGEFSVSMKEGESIAYELRGTNGTAVKDACTTVLLTIESVPNVESKFPSEYENVKTDRNSPSVNWLFRNTQLPHPEVLPRRDVEIEETWGGAWDKRETEFDDVDGLTWISRGFTRMGDMGAAPFIWCIDTDYHSHIRNTDVTELNKEVLSIRELLKRQRDLPRMFKVVCVVDSDKKLSTTRGEQSITHRQSRFAGSTHAGREFRFIRQSGETAFEDVEVNVASDSAGFDPIIMNAIDCDAIDGKIGTDGTVYLQLELKRYAIEQTDLAIEPFVTGYSRPQRIVRDSVTRWHELLQIEGKLDEDGIFEGSNRVKLEEGGYISFEVEIEKIERE